jgi:hypothetical protein
MVVNVEVSSDKTTWTDVSDRVTRLTHKLTGRELEAVDFDVVEPTTTLSVGMYVRVKRGASTVFEGIIYEVRRRRGEGRNEYTVRAYSELVLYDRRVVFRNYQTGTTAGDIIKDLAALETGVDVTNVDAGPSLTSPWEIQNAKALEIMQSTARGTNYYIRMRPGRVLYFKPKTVGTPKITFDDTNVLESEYSEDRWKLKNRVIYVGANGQVLADVSEPPGDLPVVVHDPFLTDANEAYRRAQIRLALNKEFGRELRLTVRAPVVESAGLDLFDTVRVNIPGLGLSNVDMFIVEMEYEPLEKVYRLTVGGRLELFEEFFDEAIGSDVAARFGQAVSVPEIIGSLQASVTSLQATQRVQAEGKTVRLYYKRPLPYENASNITLDSEGNIILASGFTSGSFELSCLPPSGLFTRWLRTQYLCDAGEGSVNVSLLTADNTTLFSNIPDTFDIPYYPEASGAVTMVPSEWEAVNAIVSETDAAIIGLTALRADRQTAGNITLRWPKTRDAGFQILRFFRIYLYTFADASITIKLYQDENNYLTATINNKGGTWNRWDITTATMTKTGNPTTMNWLEITADIPTLFIDSDYILYPTTFEKLKLKFNLSRPNASSISPKISLVKFVWREGK